MAAILEHIEPGSTDISDCCKGYKTDELESAGFEYFSDNHSYNFVDPKTGANTQCVERMWGRVKWRNKVQRGTAHHHLETYMWRSAVVDIVAFWDDANTQ
ncbi:hypothetical protein J6590_108413 [Homalodisca vitripennis]|nr:hypothetical protein J6590_108413 [Homalodisca vitripennis]